MGSRGKIAVLIEDHFDQTEFRMFNDFFPKHGYEVEYVTHLWENPELRFGGNPDDGRIEEHVTVKTEINNVKPSDYRGIILIGAYAMDRLRYQANPKKRQPNQAPAVAFIRRAMTERAKVGTICHSLWLLCADPSLLKGRKVTCAHNIVCDVENAGGEVVFEREGTADLVIDGNLISAKHPAVTQQFMEAFIREIEARSVSAAQ
jgi:putative intracellular protease/amidase